MQTPDIIFIVWDIIKYPFLGSLFIWSLNKHFKTMTEESLWEFLIELLNDAPVISIPLLAIMVYGWYQVPAIPPILSLIMLIDIKKKENLALINNLIDTKIEDAFKFMEIENKTLQNKLAVVKKDKESLLKVLREYTNRHTDNKDHKVINTSRRIVLRDK